MPTICARCQSDLTEAGPMPAYRLRLIQEKIPGPLGEYAVMVYKPLGQWVDELVFCNVKCMKYYLEEHENHPR